MAKAEPTTAHLGLTANTDQSQAHHVRLVEASSPTSKGEPIMAHVKYDTSHHCGATPEARIAYRLRNSGGEEADHVVQTGTGPQRVFTNIHNPGSSRQHGADNRGEPGIDSKLRGPANP